MKVWHRLLEEVSNFGELRPDRTGVGTQSLFGLSAEFLNDEDHFPAVTTKKLAVRQCFGEMSCFIDGLHTLDDFHARSCNVWDGNGNADYWKPRARFEGDLGRVYGSRWRNWRISDFREQPTPKLDAAFEATTLGIANGHGSFRGDKLKQVWSNMLHRCYNSAHKKYRRYGGRGVFVENRWLAFCNFAEDAVKLPGWSLTTGCSGLQLDKDVIGDGFRYGPSHCQWVTPEWNNPKQRIEWTVTDGSQNFVFTNAYQFCLEHNLEPSNFSRLLNKGKYRKSVKGFSLVSAKPLSSGHHKYFDQLKALVKGLKADPYSRRHIMNWWDPTEDIETALPPCHIMLQAYVSGPHLDLLVYMRSVDLVLGLPFDIAGYALLQRLVAKEVGLSSRRLLFNFGDAHIYRNHVDAVTTLLGRVPYKAPRLVIAPEAELFNFHPSMATLEGYEFHDAVKAELNV